MSVREKYKLAAIVDEIKTFESLIKAARFDEAVRFFRQNLDKPTLYGLETSLKRADLLQKIPFEKLSEDADAMFVLYALALTLNLTGGFPNKAILLYEKHDAIAERLDDDKSLSASLGHYAKALRQTGRFIESEIAAQKGLKIIRRCGDSLREAVNLYWLGMGLAQRGAAELSEDALQKSLQIFRTASKTQGEGVVNAFLAQRALWLGFYEEALEKANCALAIGEKLEQDETHADLHGAVKILIAALRMKGEALVFLRQPKDLNENDGEKFLLQALRRAAEIEFTEETLPALRALALNAFRENDFAKAREYLNRTRHLAERGEFKLYNADSYNLLAEIELSEGNSNTAKKAANKAFHLSFCDGEPYAYQSGLNKARRILQKFGVQPSD